MSDADRVVQCPTCGKSLEIADAAPRVVTCPKCLVAFANPLPTSIDTEANRVIPLDYQVGADSTSSSTTIFIVICLVVVGTLLPVAAYGIVDQNGSIVAVTVFSLLILYVFTAIAAVKPGAGPRSNTVARPTSQISTELAVFRFSVGLFAGIAISAVFWIFQMESIDPLTVFVVPAVKFCMAPTLCSFFRGGGRAARAFWFPFLSAR